VQAYTNLQYQVETSLPRVQLFGSGCGIAGAPILFSPNVSKRRVSLRSALAGFQQKAGLVSLSLSSFGHECGKQAEAVLVCLLEATCERACTPFHMLSDNIQFDTPLLN
jgi:hypothetical protein